MCRMGIAWTPWKATKDSSFVHLCPRKACNGELGGEGTKSEPVPLQPTCQEFPGHSFPPPSSRPYCQPLPSSTHSNLLPQGLWGAIKRNSWPGVRGGAPAGWQDATVSMYMPGDTPNSSSHSPMQSPPSEAKMDGCSPGVGGALRRLW